jgi:hypothetical protein
MKWRMLILAAILVVVAQAAPAADQPHPQITVSIRPSLDIPLAGSEVLYTLGGGGNIAGTYALPFFSLLSVGVDLGYHLAPLMPAELSTPGSLSVIAGSILADFRFIFLRRLELSVFLSGGYYFAFLNDEPAETGHNFCAGGGLGLSYRFSPRMGLLNILQTIVCLDMRIGR